LGDDEGYGDGGEIITLEDENGNVKEYEILDEIEYEGETFVIITEFNEDIDEENDHSINTWVIQLVGDTEDSFEFVDVADDVAKTIYQLFEMEHPEYFWDN
jgi:uncharacterized protein YrzB (UPF0473 family)